MFVALKRVRFGEDHIAPGEEVPVEPNRNYNLMLAQGLIADLDQQNRTEEAQAVAVEALQSRITVLEGVLAEANAELAQLRDNPHVHELEEQLTGMEDERNAAKTALGNMKSSLEEADAEITRLQQALVAATGASTEDVGDEPASKRKPRSKGATSKGKQE
jgi:hypothetical protein